MADLLRPGAVHVEEEVQVTERALLIRMEEWWDEGNATKAKEKAWNDLDALQGTWGTVSGRRDADFLISGARYSVRFGDGAIYTGTFELDDATQPKTMAMHIEEGPEQHRGRTTHCIYEVAGDTLRWCAGSPGENGRLAAFPGENDGRYLSLILRRE